MKTTKNIPMNGQEKYQGDYELRWVIGTDENGPAEVHDHNQRPVYRGTYAGAVKWLADRGISSIA